MRRRACVAAGLAGSFAGSLAQRAARVVLAAGPNAAAAAVGVAGGAAWRSAGAREAASSAPPFPERPVHLVVPYSPGIGPDVVARGLAAQLQARWQQPVVVDNKPGAAGIVAFSDVRRTPPDGHTVFVGDIATLAVNPLVHTQLPYEPSRDLEPLSLLFHATFVLWTSTRGRFRDIAALLAAARHDGEGVRYASLGHGHPSHVAMESLARAAGVRLLHVPFKDAGSLLSTLAAGEVDAAPFSHHTVAGLVAQGRLRALATAARRRVPTLPDVPTLAEAGAPMVEMHPWAALVTVARMPAPLLARLRDDIAAAMQAPELRTIAAQAGFELTPSTPQALRERVDADVERVRPLVAEGRIERL